jgi:DNA-binding NtrC family response regulator
MMTRKVIGMSSSPSGMPSRNRSHHHELVSHSRFIQNRIHRPTILVVDDDPDILTALADLFDHAGYGVTTVSTCVEALSQIEIHRFTSMLLDIGLPDGDGLSLLDRIQTVAPSLPVIVLTAFMTPGSTAEALSCGAFACLAKPYDRQALLALLRRAIGLQSVLPPTDY